MKRILPFLSLLILAACAPEDDHTALETSRDLTVETNMDLSAVLGMHFQDPERLVTFDKDLVLEAYVVSSDEAGNFYKEMVVQDKPDNPTAGIIIKLNMSS